MKSIAEIQQRKLLNNSEILKFKIIAKTFTGIRLEDTSVERRYFFSPYSLTDASLQAKV